MSDVEMKGWFAAATIASVVIAFITSSIDGYKKHGNRYMSVVLSGWGRILSTLIPFFIFAGVSLVSSGWEKIFQSPELAVSAFLVLLLSNQELGCALAIRRKYPMECPRVAIISMWCLLWLCAALASTILIFQADHLPIIVTIWQFILFIVAVLTYFASAAVVQLVEIGYKPKKNNRGQITLS